MTKLKTLLNLNYIDDDKLMQVRNLAFSICGFVACLTALVIDLVMHMPIISTLAGITALAFLVGIWFCLENKLGYFRLIVLVFVNGLLFLISYAQGRETAAFLYYIPFIFCIPFIFGNKKKYDIGLLSYVVMSAACAFACMSLSPETGTWEPVHPERLETVFNINASISIILTILCSLSIIYSDRFFRDILAKKIDRAEMMNLMKNRFLSGTSHELRTAINGVTSAAYMLQGNSGAKEQEEHFRILKYCSDHMVNIVNEILDFDKIVAGKLELHPRVFNISKLLTDAPLPFLENMREKKLQFRSAIDKKLDNRFVLSDDFRILQVINNLLSNAVKFTEKGSVSLSARQADEDETNIRLLIEVSDTGIGIEEKDLDKIFSEYWQVYNEKTLNNRGTGLGLSISKNILKLFNSDLLVESHPGKGSIFSFMLELKKVSFAHVPGPEEEKTTSSLENLHVLVAEDDPVNMMVATKILESKKAIVHKAINGIEVMNMLNEGKEHIDFVLMDLEMPLMSGYEAICQIRERKYTVPVIAFTAAMMDKHMEAKLIKSGFNGCIAKPFKPEIFFTRIESILQAEKPS